MSRRSLVITLGLLVACTTARPDRAHTAAPTSTQAEYARTDLLSAEQVVDANEVNSVALSPDGKTIAFTMKVPPPDNGKVFGSEIWVVPTRGGEPRRLTAPGNNARSPAWSPNGKTLAFLAKRNGDEQTQVYLIAPDGGEARAVTKAKSSVSSFEWSPNGRSIAFLAARIDSAEAKKDKDEGRDWIVGDVSGTPDTLWVSDLEGTAKAVTPPALNVLAMRWSPDGKQFALHAAERPDIDGEMMYSALFTVSASGGEPKSLVATQGKLGDLAWSPDGSQVAYLGAADIHDPTAGVVWLASIKGGKPRALTMALPATGQTIRWVAKDAMHVLFHEGTRTPVLRVDTKGGTKRVVDGPICRDLEVAKDGNTFACAGETAQHPREVFAGRGKLARITRSNPTLDKVRLGRREIVKWKGAGGDLEIEGVVTLPVDYVEGQKYPLAILPHGGPEGVSLDGWNTRAGYPTQLFATAGYVVLEPNYRGSSGYGVAFGKADQKDLGGKEFEDVLAGIDALVARGLVDGDRVGMGGWSYGGYFSGLAASKHSKRFKAAMVGAAITDWISFTGTSEIEHENTLVHWDLWVWDEPELAWDRSPMAHTKGSKTATLIVHGADDSRVPPEQATELYRALRHHGAPTEVVFYPREGHGLRERAHQIDFAKRFVGWFDTYVKG